MLNFSTQLSCTWWKNVDITYCKTFNVCAYDDAHHEFATAAAENYAMYAKYQSEQQFRSQRRGELLCHRGGRQPHDVQQV